MDKKSLKKTILIAPLDWGLGHAARCVPIIRQLQSYHFNIILAVDGAVKSMLKAEFPDATFIYLPGYKIRYAKHKRWFHLSLLMQFPKIIRLIVFENRWLKKVVKEYNINAIISDNRFGLYHSAIPSVYITHQLFIKTGNGFSEAIASCMHHWFIKKYTHCWVPDFKGQKNAAGELSHPVIIPKNVQYIGCLSRFEKIPAAKQIDLLVILSGPEPQRSIFETLLIEQLTGFDGKVLFIRGLPGNKASLLNADKPGIIFKNHLDAAALNNAIESSQLVISRSGYTTVMDLLKLGQKAVLVPTPGQAEQEYLAAYLSAQQIFYTASQDNFLLKEILREIKNFDFKMLDMDMELYKNAVRQFVATL